MNPELLLADVMNLLVDTVCVVDAEGRFVFVSASCERLFGYTQEELIGRKMIDLVFPEDRERTLQAASNIMRGELQTHFENRYVRKDGRIVHIMWSARWSESKRVRLAVARDVTEIKRAARKQSAIYQISEAAHTADGLLALYHQIHQVIRDLLPADNFAVALYDESSDTLSFPYSVEERGQGTEPHSLDSGTPLAQVIRGGRALLMTSSGASVDTGAGWGLSGNCVDWLGVPLISQNGVVGALVVKTYSRSVRYTEDDKDLLQFVSTQIATAIERKQAEIRLRHIALHDELTSLPNRTLFQDRFDMALTRARRAGEHLALLYLDLDGFKYVNDTFGHEIGDRLLQEVAGRLAKCVRESDTVGRIGGDEFTVLLTDIRGPDCVAPVVEKICASIGAPFELGRHSLAISASIGSAIYPEHGSDKEQLVRHADARMYAAKTSRS